MEYAVVLIGGLLVAGVASAVIYLLQRKDLAEKKAELEAQRAEVEKRNAEADAQSKDIILKAKDEALKLRLALAGRESGDVPARAPRARADAS